MHFHTDSLATIELSDLKIIIVLDVAYHYFVSVNCPIYLTRQFSNSHIVNNHCQTKLIPKAPLITIAV